MTFGLITLGLLTYAQSSGVQAATSAEGLGIGKLITCSFGLICCCSCKARL